MAGEGVINSNITARDYTPRKQISLLNLLGSSVDKGVDAGAAAARQQTEGQQKMQQIGAEGKNKIAAEQETGNQARLTGDHAMQTSQDTLNKLYGTDNLADAQKKATAAGQSLKLGKDDIGIGQNELMRVQQQLNNQDMHAAGEALKGYNTQLPHLQQQWAPIQQGLNAISDKKNTTSLGAARAALLKAYGLQRFNQDEARAQIGDSATGALAKVFNAAGDDMTPLTDPQRRDAMNALLMGAQNIKNNHDQIRDSALTTYQTMSPNGSRGAILQGQLGNNGFASGISDAIGKYQPMYAQAQADAANPNSGGVVKQGAGMLGGMANFLVGNRGGAQPPTTTAGGPAKKSGLQAFFAGTPPAGATPPAPKGAGSPPPGMSFEDFKAWRAGQGNAGAQ